ncbi:branched-chain amino acid ABC transporter permease [Paraburkholderia sp. CNPSo 3076]|uniref:branched-chain amino acid ABC transporter permease n=1 Tax=Paraburkholderia sp. CNPSo 3076 TaxID=2940936 RepID=UPI00224FDE00|nr:branched-chain amino acid ABC transporter permease [Paraburkholderia sp. CNPSo 3076]MCX5542131.1 branched-chain amino acid ABC transporter permease [Paraburkholderia sp. CNPSo 3076]
MTEIFGLPVSALIGQLIIGLVNGSFYAILSLGLAVIFGLLGIINFSHGALYMMGGILTWMGLNYLGASYWVMLVAAPIIVGLIGAVMELTLLKRIYRIDPVYGLLLTFGVALVIEGGFRSIYGVSGQPYSAPDELAGVLDLHFLTLPTYRVWVVLVSVVVCVATWFLIERTKVGSYLRAAIENPKLVEAFGVDVPFMVTLTYAVGVGLAALAGVLAAPVIQVSPLMGSNSIITVFAVVVIGGMGSIAGSIVTGLSLGLIEGLTRVVYPELSETIVFILMALILVVRPAGLFGKQR